MQTLFIDVARGTARSEGWYEERRGAQKFFVVFALLAATVFAWRFVSLHGLFLRQHRSLAAVLVVVVLYTLLGSATINHGELEVPAVDPFSATLLVEMLVVVLSAYGAARACIATSEI